jgi:hypothetical protein
LAGNTPAIDIRVDNVKPPPGFAPKPEAVSEEALVRWEREQHDALTRRHARLTMLESIEQDRKDSAQDEKRSEAKRLGKSVEEPVPDGFTVPENHYNEFVPGEGSSSMPRLGLLPDLPDESENLESKESTQDTVFLASSLSNERPLSTDPVDDDPTENQAAPTSVYVDVGTQTDESVEAIASLVGLFELNALIPYDANKNYPPPKARLRPYDASSIDPQRNLTTPAARTAPSLTINTTQ